MSTISKIKVKNNIYDIEDTIAREELAKVKETAETAESIAKGANQCKTYVDYPTFIEAFNLIPKDKYNVGQDIRIIQVNVPDIWIAAIEEESVEYVYTSDEDFINELATNGVVQIGFYKFGMLETQKVDLTDYIKHSDYPTATRGGAVKVSATYATYVNASGMIMAAVKSFSSYKTSSTALFISKGTLDNVLNGREVTLTETEYNALVDAGEVDEDVEYNIVEE